MNITESFREFSLIYRTEVTKTHSKNLLSYDLLVNQLPALIKDAISLNDNNLIIKGSIGAGVNTYYPWLGIFDNRVSSGATNGFYIALLFSNDFKDLYLTINQGSTIQTKEIIIPNTDFGYSLYNNIEGFEKGALPAGSLVKIEIESSSKNGKKYEETNIFYKKYEIENLVESEFINNLNDLLEIYSDCASKFSQRRPEIPALPSEKFNLTEFLISLQNAGLIFSSQLIQRFVASLCTKPFLICSGLSGSGKTKLAHAFAQWICYKEAEGEKNRQYCIVPVGADWTNREPLLGYPNALKPEEYVKPDSGVLDLIIQANNQPDLPHFLILDEMNLSHVERYFADFLSVMESKEEIPLYAEGTVENGVPAKLKVPINLFIIGTVNIDETTNMFSPKVLDRANTIEFRVTKEEMKGFLGNMKDINMDALTGKGAGMAKSFLNMAENKSFAATDIEAINATMVQFFGELKKTGAEFGYRSATEIVRLINQLTVLDSTMSTNQKIDIAIIQKLLPKLHGSRRKLCPVLETLGSFCISGEIKIIKDVFEEPDFDFQAKNVLYSLSLEKISRMYRGAIDNGFASFAEA